MVSRCVAHTWKPCVLEMGGFALNLTHRRPPIDGNPVTCTDTRGNFLSRKEWPAFPALAYVLFFHQDVWRSHCKAQEWALYCQAGAHKHHKQFWSQGRITQLPHGIGSHYALYTAHVPFDWKSHTSRLSMEKLHISKLCCPLIPPCLSSCPCIQFEGWEGDDSAL